MTKIAPNFKFCKCMVHSHLGMGAVAKLVLGVTSSAKVLGKQSAVLGGQTVYSSGLTLWDKTILCSFSTFVSKPWILFCSAGMLFFFFHTGGIFTNFDNPYNTHCHHYLWKSWRCFVHFLFYIVFSFFSVVVVFFIVDLHLTYSSALCTKLGG